MSEKEKKQDKFDVVKLLSLVSNPEQKFSPKISKKLWDDAEIVMLGAMVKHLRERGVENKELKQTINQRLDDFEKSRKDKEYNNDEINPVSDESIEIDKIKQARDEINITRLSSVKKLSAKTKDLLKNAFTKAVKEKQKKGDIIINPENQTQNKEKEQDVSDEEKQRVNEMLDIAVKSGVIDKSDLGLH